VLGEPLGGRLWFAGEAVHETLWGTVGGAWQSGVRAAEAALRHIGALNEREEEKETTRERKKIKREPRRSRRRRREQ
jgi:Flavin containing amine oxidoreductase